MNIYFKNIFSCLLVCCVYCLNAQPGQLEVSRISAMPDQPTPYSMRDWKTVAVRFDSFVYNVNKTGQYLPLISYASAGINYPSQKQIRLHTYVGTKSTQNSEGINVLPSLVGAALCGQDIRQTYGVDRLVMAQDFFNKANGENIYLNNSSAGSGGDWWYDVMPNLYFYQLYNKYPAFNGEASAQFLSVAEKFKESVQKMGGQATPWTPAYMNYRAWNFKTMEPNANGVKEPESAGTFGWILYHAYRQTGNKEYLKAAEWSMEYLNSLTINPSYELQLPYGAYTAAKMNAETGTRYDVPKMVNWCFNKGPLRGWGTIVGKWGSFDVSGLVGEANDGGNDYAFVMNGMQQASALVPMVRYDKRFAKAIGKWMLNLSNASRLFYPGFLPSNLQDGATWSQQYDPDGVIAHEAMKQKYQNLSPYATGDALGGGWAATNLAVYGSSSVGYLGAIVSKTNVDKILQLNLNSTDFYSNAFYPSFLYFNPYDTPKTLIIDTGSGVHNVYDALSEKFIAEAVSGQVTITISAKEAILTVITPAGGKVTYDKNKMLVNGIVTDYNQSKVPFSYPPRIKALEPKSLVIEKGKRTSVFCTAEDLDSDVITYQWFTDQGVIDGNSNEVIWTAPLVPGTAAIKVVVKDSDGNSDSLSVNITVVDIINKAPIIDKLYASDLNTSKSQSISLFCFASDENDDTLTYTWTTDKGQVNGSGQTVSWTAPDIEGIYTVFVSVDDGKGLSAKAQIFLLVKEFTGSGQIIAWYPFDGNADDKSGNGHHGTPNGTILTADFNGQQSGAYYFNGGSQHIEVANKPALNVENAITISLWCKPNLSGDKEKFLISHGSWQNRWKISFTPTGFLRWTVNSSVKVTDLDSDFPLTTDSIYHIVASYDGETMMLFINGKLNTFRTQSGKIRVTSLPLLIGQMIPADASYNFKGVMDEIRIFDYAIHPDQVKKLYQQGISSSIRDVTRDQGIFLYPNPADQSLIINFNDAGKYVSYLLITDINGAKVFECSKTFSDSYIVDTSYFNKGMYKLVLSAAGGHIIRNFTFIKS